MSWVHTQTPRFTDGWPINLVVRMVLEAIECKKDPLVSVQLNIKCNAKCNGKTHFIVVLSHG
jgi:hypothetical protein